jgi:hypothetical protein
MSNPLNDLLLQPSPLGEVFVSAVPISGPASYTTGGVTISANTFALLTIKVLISSMLSTSGTYFVRFKIANGSGSPTATVVWYTASSGAEVGNDVDLSAETIKVIALGN